VHSNPSILEVLVSPVRESTPEGEELRQLFSRLWSSEGVYKAFCGYSHNQLKKFIDEKDSRPWKYMVARIRTLISGIELLRYGTMTVDVDKQYAKFGLDICPQYTGPGHRMPPTLKDYLMGMKRGELSRGYSIDWGQQLVGLIKQEYDKNPNKLSDFNAANEFLLRMRKTHWD
jgi:hypothetical protein